MGEIRKGWRRFKAHSPILTLTASPIGSRICGTREYSTGRREERNTAGWFVCRANEHAQSTEKLRKTHGKVSQVKRSSVLGLTWHPGSDGLRHGSSDATKCERHRAGISPFVVAVHPGYRQLVVMLVYILANPVLNEVTTLGQGQGKPNEIRLLIPEMHW